MPYAIPDAAIVEFTSIFWPKSTGKLESQSRKLAETASTGMEDVRPDVERPAAQPPRLIQMTGATQSGVTLRIVSAL